MTKSTIPEFSATPSANTDLDGIGLNPPDLGGNLKLSIQHLMKILRRTNDGTSPLDDTFKVRDPDDTSKTGRLDLVDVPTGTNRDLNAEKLYQAAEALNLTVIAKNGSPTETIYTASGTHTFATTSKYFQIFAVGGGGGGGGVDGQGASSRAAASGGGSGFFGQTTVLTKGIITAGAVVIGAGGAGGAGLGGAVGIVGGTTTWIDGVNTFAWGGGRRGTGMVAEVSSSYSWAVPANAATAAGAIIGGCDRNTSGFITSNSTSTSAAAVAQGGLGGSCPYGIGGDGGNVSAGGAGTGYGSGGGGAAVSDSTANYAGGAGAAGILIVREW